MTKLASDFAEIEEVISLLVNVLVSAHKLPLGAERNAALIQIDAFQKRLGAIMIQRGMVSERHC